MWGAVAPTGPHLALLRGRCCAGLRLYQAGNHLCRHPAATTQEEPVYIGIGTLIIIIILILLLT